MSEISRRDCCAMSLSRSAGWLQRGAGAARPRHGRGEKQSAGGVYKPKVFNAHEYATLRRLCDLIVPADEQSKGALDAGAPEFIDLLAEPQRRDATIYTGGIVWLDNAMMKRHRRIGVDAKPEQQTALLDLIAYRKKRRRNSGRASAFSTGPGR